MTATEPPLDLADLERELRAHLTLCSEIHILIQREHQQLKRAPVSGLKELFSAREGLLERVTTAQHQLFAHKAAWLRLSPDERAHYPHIGSLIRQNLDLIMKIVVLDRENEKLLLTHKLVPPGHLPRPERQKPNLVAQRYRAHR